MYSWNSTVLLLALLLPLLNLELYFIAIEFLDKKESAIMGYLNKILFFTDTFCRVKTLMQTRPLLSVAMIHVPFLYILRKILLKKYFELSISVNSSITNTTQTILWMIWALKVEIHFSVSLMLSSISPLQLQIQHLEIANPFIAFWYSWNFSLITLDIHSSYI